MTFIPPECSARLFGLGPILTAEHREIEDALERISAENLDFEAFRHVHSLCERHYLREEAFLARLPDSLAAKLRAQHAEALEIAGRIEESLSAGQTADAIYLARRFLAIVQHNIIEEERDVFPLFP
jgi:hypothetical protein